MVEGESELSGVLSYKGTNPIYKGSALMIQLRPKGLTSKYQHIGDYISTDEFEGEGMEIQSLATLERWTIS